MRDRSGSLCVDHSLCIDYMFMRILTMFDTHVQVQQEI